MQIQIKHDHLRAVSLFMAKQDVRYYLNGVLVEVSARAVRLASTNGSVMALTHTATPEDEPDMAPLELILPADTVNAIVKARCNKYLPVILSMDDGKHSLVYGSTSINFDPVDGTFPNYRRVIPETYDGTPAQYNPEYLYTFQKAAKVYGRKIPITIAYNGLKAALIGSVDEEFLGVIMPMRNDPPTLPSWFAEPVELAAAA